MMTKTSFLALLAAAAAAFAPAASAAADAQAGQRKANICQGCHNLDNFKAVFPEVYRIPRIRGQSAEYIVYALNEYKNGTRFVDSKNNLDPLMSMTAIVASLTDEDIADLAAYYSSLGQ